MRRIPIGVTGGPGSGKSTIVAMIAQLGLKTASADEIVAELWLDEEFQKKFRQECQWQRPIQKDEIRSTMLADSEFRLKLEKLIHREVVQELLASECQAAEVPLLFEACIQSLFDNVIAVSCGLDEQLRRLTERLGSAEAAVQLVATQLPEVVKVSLADFEIRTDAPISDVNTSVRTILVQAGILGVT